MSQRPGAIVVAVALAITACGDGSDTGDVATDTTSEGDEVVDEVPPCSELFAPGQTTEQVLAAIGMDTTENMQTGGRCSDEEGGVSVQLLAYTTCASGNRVWYTSDYGYGVAGGTWTAFPEGTSPPPDC